MTAATLPTLLARVPGVYDDLVDASLPGRTGKVPDSSPDPRDKPAPGNLSVLEHRHLLLRGLRWWVDAVRDDAGKAPVGDSPTAMCRVLLRYLPAMADEDRDQLTDQLQTWLDDAWPYLGDPDPGPAIPQLPREALDQLVPVHVAAQALGVTVRTIRRRAPDRTDGRVLLRDAAGPSCDQSDLPAAWCAHCRTL